MKRYMACSLGAVLAAYVAVTSFSRVGLAVGNEFVGQTPPEIAISGFINPTPNMPKTLKDLQGHVVLLEFWATWCPPCRAMIPHMNELFEKYSARGLQIISVTKEKPEVVKPFVEEHGMKYPIGLDAGATAKSYGIKSIPTAYLIGTDGKVIWQGHPKQREDGVIEKALQSAEKK